MRRRRRSSSPRGFAIGSAAGVAPGTPSSSTSASCAASARRQREPRWGRSEAMDDDEAEHDVRRIKKAMAKVKAELLRKGCR